MKTIWKYELKGDDLEDIVMPINAEILSVQVQKKGIYLWCIVDTDEDKIERRFEMVCTGGYIEEDINRKYLATIQYNPTNLVFHIFEVSI